MIMVMIESLIFSFPPPPATCAQRCYTSGSQGGCYCDSACTFFDDCCSDFDSICDRTPGSDNPGAREFVLELILLVAVILCVVVCV